MVALIGVKGRIRSSNYVWLFDLIVEVMVGTSSRPSHVLKGNSTKFILWTTYYKQTFCKTTVHVKHEKDFIHIK